MIFEMSEWDLSAGTNGPEDQSRWTNQHCARSFLSISPSVLSKHPSQLIHFDRRWFDLLILITHWFNIIIMNITMFRSTYYKSLIKTVTISYMLNQFPESSKDNQQSQALSILLILYQLSFQREKKIVDNLTFLSAITNDSIKIMKICLEKARDRKSCTIRLTLNTNDLDEIINEFKFIARIVKRATSRDLAYYIRLNITIIS